MREIKCANCGHINTGEGIKPYPAINGKFYELDLWCGGCDALILMKVDKEDVTVEVKDKKLFDALEEFIENYNGVLDLNDTTEFIFHEREHLLKLLKEWDESK